MSPHRTESANELRRLLRQERRTFMVAINFAIDLGPDAAAFLTLWREGAWTEIASEYPAFPGPFPQ